MLRQIPLDNVVAADTFELFDENIIQWIIASGVCFAFILLSSFTSFRAKEIPLTVILVAAIFLGQQIYEGIIVQDNISNMAHVFGGIVGGIIGFSLNKK